MTTSIRTALIGAGYIADWHAEGLKMTPGVELTAVCDLSKGAAEALAGAHGAQAFGDLDASFCQKLGFRSRGAVVSRLVPNGSAFLGCGGDLAPGSMCA